MNIVYLDVPGEEPAVLYIGNSAADADTAYRMASSELTAGTLIWVRKPIAYKRARAPIASASAADSESEDSESEDSESEDSESEDSESEDSESEDSESEDSETKP